MIEFNATFLVAMFSFVVFIFIMNAIFYKPILSIMRKREEYINSNYSDAKNFINKSQEIDERRNSEIKNFQDKCRQNIKIAIEQAHDAANKKTQSIRQEAKNEMQARKEKLLEDEKHLENMVQQTVVNDLASAISSKLVKSLKD